MEKALELLIEDRKTYLKKVSDYLKFYLDRNRDEEAQTAIITAGQELQRLDGAIQYLEQFKKNEYPRFGTIL